MARATFAREAPLTPVDLGWYGGMHAWGYSLVSPWLLALVGVPAAGVAAAVGGAVLLARLRRSSRRPWAGALLGAVFSVADVASGRTTFALGAVAALGALAVLPRRVSAVALGVLTGLLSPVAAAFLGLAAAVLVVHRRPGGWLLGLAASLPVAVLALLFPSGGTQPYDPVSALPACAAGLVLAALTTSPLLRTAGLAYAASSLLLVVAPGPFGSNVLRLGLLLAAPLVAATALPLQRRHLVPVVAALAWWQVQPTWSDLRAATPPRFGPLARALEQLGAQRVEVVPPRDHGEAASLVTRVSLARGWSRQVDAALNPLFYEDPDEPLDVVRYRRWLDDNAVDHVAVPLTTFRLDRAGRAEALTVGLGRVPGLVPVQRLRDWRVYAVEGARPLVSGAARLERAGRSAWVLRADRGGTAQVALRWSRWLTVTGPACLERDGDRVRLRLAGAGEVRLSSSLRPRGRCG